MVVYLFINKNCSIAQKKKGDYTIQIEITATEEENVIEKDIDRI